MRVVAMAVAPELVSPLFGDDGLARLEAAHVLRWAPAGEDPHDPAVFRRLLADAEAVITSWGCPPLDAATLAAAPRLALLAHTGASVKPLVTAASWRRPVRVTQAGAGMAPSVAEAALALTLALLHRINRFDHALRGGAPWDEAKHAPARRELAGSRVGVIGASRTGVAYARMARALGAHVSIADPHLPPEEAVDLSTLLRESRVVAVHAPALPETRHLLGAAELALMPDGAVLINTARSWLVDEAALLAELRTGRIDAGLDVYDEEPLPRDHPLRALPNVLLTPHEAGGSVEARRRQGVIVVDELDRFARGEPLRHEVREADLARMG